MLCRWIPALLLSTSMFSSAFAQSAALPLFADDSILRLTIEGPIRRLYNDRRERPDLEGIVRYVDEDGTEVVLDVELTARGNTRLDICSFPPVWLNSWATAITLPLLSGHLPLNR